MAEVSQKMGIGVDGIAGIDHYAHVQKSVNCAPFERLRLARGREVMLPMQRRDLERNACVPACAVGLSGSHPASLLESLPYRFCRKPSTASAVFRHLFSDAIEPLEPGKNVLIGCRQASPPPFCVR